MSTINTKQFLLLVWGYFVELLTPEWQQFRRSRVVLAAIAISLVFFGLVLVVLPQLREPTPWTYTMRFSLIPYMALAFFIVWLYFACAVYMHMRLFEVKVNSFTEEIAATVAFLCILFTGPLVVVPTILWVVAGMM
jgi:hypothetical protein